MKTLTQITVIIISLCLLVTPLSAVDTRGRETNFTYDAMDRVASRQDPLGKVERYGYDKGSNLTEFTDRRGTSTAYRYDALGRLTFVGYAQTGSGAGASHESTVTYAYDAKSRLETVIDSQAGTMTFGYDALDRLTSERTPQGVVTYGFDKAGRRVRMQVTGQPEVTYGYDDADRLTQIVQGGATVGFGYDAADRRSSMTLPNGVSVEYGYDAASQLTVLSYKRGQTTLGDLSYDYDAAGRRTQVGGSFARTGLPEAVTGAVYDDANRLTSRGAQTFTYDDNGNLTSDGQRTYTWDARNRLVGITGATQASFSYDAFGRRVGKAAGGQSTGFLYDGANIVQQQGSVISNVIAGAIDENLSCGCGTNGAQQSFLADAQGSTVALTDANGNIESQYTYEPFGATTQAGATSSNAAKYTGREDDEATGLYYYRARYYSPQLQRFISQDGAGFGAGDANLYAYTSNDPINRVDPSGNIAPLLAACAGGALFDAGMYVGLELLSGRKPSWSGAGSAALIGCGSGMAGFGIAKAVGAVWRGVKAGQVARVAQRADDAAPPACFEAGTLVHSKEGTKPIEEVKVGDEVLSWNERSNSVEYKSVARVFVREAEYLLDVSIRGEETMPLGVTAEHPFYVRHTRNDLSGEEDADGEWTPAGELKVGDEVRRPSGEWVAVTSIERREGKVEVYNFEVRDNHNYFVGELGTLVHNNCLWRPHFSGADKPWRAGATPNSIYTHVDPKTGRAVQNAVYDGNGDVIAHVDFKNHGVGSGHWHPFSQPGNPASGHGPGAPHLPNSSLPDGWGSLPSGVLPHTPIGR